jgi:hypothetical protein
MADSTALYSFKGAAPTTLPHKIRPSEGVVRTDVSTFTDEELKDAGYTGPYTVPSHNNENQRVVWDSDNLALIVENFSDEELWASARSRRNQLLADSDWTMAADSPGELILAEWEKYRQRLRDLPKTFSDDPRNITWPTSPDKQESFDITPVVEDRIRWRVQDSEGTIAQLVSKLNLLTDRVIACESKVGIATT